MLWTLSGRAIRQTDSRESAMMRRISFSIAARRSSSRKPRTPSSRRQGCSQPARSDQQERHDLLLGAPQVGCLLAVQTGKVTGRPSSSTEGARAAPVESARSMRTSQFGARL